MFLFRCQLIVYLINSNASLFQGGEAGSDILPLLMNMQKPPVVDPITGALMPHEQDPNEMMMLMALTGQNPAMMGPQAMMGL